MQTKSTKQIEICAQEKIPLGGSQNKKSQYSLGNQISFQFSCKEEIDKTLETLPHILHNNNIFQVRAWNLHNKKIYFGQRIPLHDTTSTNLFHFHQT